VDGILYWETCALMPLVQALFDQYGHGVLLDGEWFSVDEPYSDESSPPELEPECATAGRFAWTTTQRRDICR